MVGNFLGSFGIAATLATVLRSAGFQVITTSAKSRRVLRLIDMLKTAVLNRRKYDVAQVDVYSGLAFVWAEVICFVLRRLGKPYVLTLHGGNLPAFARRYPRRVKRLLRSARCVTAPSTYLSEKLQRYRPDLHLLPNGLDVHLYPVRVLTDPKPRLLWLRAFHRVYNPILAPRVLAELARSIPDPFLTMIGHDRGDGTFEAVRDEAEKLGVLGCIEFPGPIRKEDVPSWFSRADIFINTTNVDNAPLSVLEAMAAGLCVVSTNVGGIPYLLEHEKNSLLVPPNDPVAMADAVRRLLSNPVLANSLSRNARAKAAQFDWSVVLPRWDHLMASVVEPPE